MSSLFEPPEKPILTIGNTDVMVIDKEHRVVSIVVKIKCDDKDELKSEENIRKVKGSVNVVTKYLSAEGFLGKVPNWNMAVTVLGYNPE
jgi:hypothetical protein